VTAAEALIVNIGTIIIITRINDIKRLIDFLLKINPPIF